jgi:hypothetical protein
VTILKKDKIHLLCRWWDVASAYRKIPPMLELLWFVSQVKAKEAVPNGHE